MTTRANNALGIDLHLDLPPDAAPTRGRGAQQRRRVAQALRTAISTGRLAAGSRIPPYRSLADDLGLARGTVAGAYADLVAEGWLVARRGSGTRVSESMQSAPAITDTHTDTPAPPAHDFMLGQPNSSLFPRADWIAATRRVMGSVPDAAFGPGHPQGSRELREALAGYLARVRGVRVSAAQIVLTTSVMSGLELLSRTVIGDVIAVESHGLPFHRDALVRGGTQTVPVPLDEDGALVDEIPTRATAALLTPSHQFPTGVALSPQRRVGVVEWARSTGSLIVEDDYDGELRYDREPVGALQSLGPDVVIYTGSVSKSLSPAVRIAWLVLPPHLVDTVVWAKGIREPDASVVDQLIVADLISTGAYDRHIRRSRQYYRARRDHLVDALTAIGVESPGIAAGLHAVIPAGPTTEAALIAEAGRRRFALAWMSFFRHPDATDPPRGGLVVGFGTPSASAFTGDVEELVSLVADYLPNRRLRAEKSRSARRKSTRRNSGQ